MRNHKNSRAVLGFVVFVTAQQVKKIIESPNKSAHNKQEEEQEESWRTPNINSTVNQ